MRRGRPTLAENPYAYRVIIRNFIDKYGETKLQRFLELGKDMDLTRSYIAADLGVGFWVVSRLQGIVFGDGAQTVRAEVVDFLKDYYDLDFGEV